MTTIFSTKKTLQNRFAKRILGMEALENREMLNGTGADNYFPDFVETSATKSSENIDLSVAASSVEFATDGDDLTAAPAAATNSLATVSGVTTNAATITWTKPTLTADRTAIRQVTKYTLYYGTNTDDKTWTEGIDCGTKTSWALTGLEQGETYYFKVVVTGTLRDDSSSAIADNTIAASGSFTAEAVTLADEMAVGRPTNVKTTPSDSSVKITWTAPVNYTGGYEVTITNKKFGDLGAFTVAAGAKTEATITIDGSAESLATNALLSNLKLKKGDRYEVVILPTSGNASGTNGLASTPTNFVAQKAQSDEKPTVTVKDPDTPSATLFTVTSGAGNIVIKKASDQSVPPGVDGYWIAVATNVNSTLVANATYVTKAQFEASAGVTIGNLSAGSYDVKIFAANSAGESGELVLNGNNNHYTATPPTAIGSGSTNSANSVSATKDGTVANKVKVTWTTNSTAIGNDNNGYVPVSYDVYYSTKNQNQWVLAGNVLADASLELTIENLAYSTEYDFAVVANCDVLASSAPKVAQLTEAGSTITIDAAPTIPSAQAEVDANILTAKKVKEVEYAANAVTFSLEANTASGTKILPDQYYVVLRDANKAVIANDFIAVTTSGTLSLSSGIVLTPKAQYTVEVYGIAGTKISSAKASTSLKVADYPAATLKVTGGTKATVNGVSITVTDKTVDTDKFYYVQYTSVADAKGKADWSTATVEKLAATNVSATGGDAYALATKLDPNTQYYVRIVTSDTDVKITTGPPNSWTIGTAPLDDWIDATTVVFGKEIKVKTAAVPLATVGKPGFGFDASTYNITLKTVGQTMLSAKGAGDLFGSSKPLENAQFTYKLLVSLDSKVDKVTGKLLGSAEINLTENTHITIAELPAKGSTPKVDKGQYTLEYALTGSGGILDELGITASNASSLKNLNFQLVTTVTYSGVSFDSVTKPGKVAMPKWFV